MTARLFIEIRTDKRASLYCAELLKPDARVATKAWRLWRPNGRYYDVAMSSQGYVSCTCPDAVYRDHPCKHIAALQEFNLLPRGR